VRERAAGFRNERANRRGWLGHAGELTNYLSGIFVLRLACCKLLI